MHSIYCLVSKCTTLLQMARFMTGLQYHKNDKILNIAMATELAQHRVLRSAS